MHTFLLSQAMDEKTIRLQLVKQAECKEFVPIATRFVSCNMEHLRVTRFTMDELISVHATGDEQTIVKNRIISKSRVKLPSSSAAFASASESYKDDAAELETMLSMEEAMEETLPTATTPMEHESAAAGETLDAGDVTMGGCIDTVGGTPIEWVDGAGFVMLQPIRFVNEYFNVSDAMQWLPVNRFLMIPSDLDMVQTDERLVKNGLEFKYSHSAIRRITDIHSYRHAPSVLNDLIKQEALEDMQLYRDRIIRFPQLPRLAIWIDGISQSTESVYLVDVPLTAWNTTKPVYSSYPCRMPRWLFCYAQLLLGLFGMYGEKYEFPKITKIQVVIAQQRRLTIRTVEFRKQLFESFKSKFEMLCKRYDALLLAKDASA